MRNHQDPFARKNRPGYKPLFTSRTLTSVLALGTALAAPVTNAVSSNFSSNGAVTDTADTGNMIGGFRGYITGGSGSATRYNNFNSEGALADHVFVGSSTAIIDWKPYSSVEGGTGAINMLPAGNSLVFQGDRGTGGNFTVVNRILPTDSNRQIALNGTIRSLVEDSTAIGGNVWFYSPGGLLIGSSATINVGGLILTSLDPTNLNSNGATFTNTSSLVRGGPVQIMTGAQIMASNYIGVIAPSLTQAGSVTVGNGSTDSGAAYVAAEAANVTINQGLFDINVTLGTDANAFPLIHSGSTTGPSAGVGNYHRIEFVAVPKNSAITALIQGGPGTSLGFDIAGAANVSGNQIILSAGYNVQGGISNVNTPFDFDNPVAGAARVASFNISGGTFTSAVNGIATQSASISALGNTTFPSFLALTAPNVSIGATGVGNNLSIGGPLYLDASKRVSVAGEAIVGGNASLFASDGGNINVSGNVTVSADAFGHGLSNAAVGATGGNASINASRSSASITDSSTINIGGMAYVTANATAYSGLNGTSTMLLKGGSVFVGANYNNNTVHIGTGLYAAADGLAASTGVGARGQGGTVNLAAFGGSAHLQVDGGTQILVRGMGDAGSDAGGSGLGGFVFLSPNTDSVNGTPVGTFNGLSIDASGTGGAGQNLGGTGTGGQVNIGTAVAVNQGVQVIPSAQSQAQFNNTGGIQVDANGTGGASGMGVGGNGVGGRSVIFANGGTVTSSGITTLNATAITGSGLTGSGNATGGFAQIGALSANVTINGDMFLSADARSGNGSNQSQVGTITGGQVLVSRSGNGTSDLLGNLSMGANGLVDEPANDYQSSGGGNGTGGSVGVNSSGGTTHISGSVTGYAQGRGGSSESDTFVTGTGQGGNANISAFTDTTNGTVGRVTIDGGVLYEVSGFGGVSRTGSGAGGAGYGGNINVNANNTGTTGGTTIGTAQLFADGRGGEGDVAGVARGGTILLTGNGGNITTAGLTLTAKGELGSNESGSAVLNSLTDGFAVQGGTIRVQHNNTGITLINGLVDADASAYADIPEVRQSAGGGNARGGLVDIYAAGGALTIGGGTNIRADAYAGSSFSGGATPGNAVGGRVAVNGAAGSTTTVGGVTLGHADAYGGQSDGDIGGAGTGGQAAIGGAGGNLQITRLDFAANGFGGDANLTGGAGTGGFAGISGSTNGGTIAIGGDSSPTTVSLRADGTGGSASGGSFNVFAPVTATGGTGTGGTAQIDVNTSIVTIGTTNNPGAALLYAQGAGGGGVQGGTGIGGDAVAVALNGGRLTVTENTQGLIGIQLYAQGTGGNSGNESGMVGNGGRGIGGYAQLQALSSNGAVSQVTVGRALLNVSGAGGNGGTASSFINYADGGAGGDGFGGTANLLSTSGGGRLTLSGDATVIATGIGGVGGNGVFDGEADGSLGGTGGAGYGGVLQGGLISGGSLTVTNGSASFAGYIVNATGQGGDGGFGAMSQGNYVSNGGTGGIGVGGFGNILGRGAPVSATSVTITAIGQGGNGGAGETQGAGGDGFGGAASAIASSRFQTTTVNTMSIGGALTFQTSGSAGGGSTGGVSVQGNFQLQALDGATLNVGTVTINNTGTVGNRPFFDPFTNISGSNPVDPSNISALFGGKLNVTGSGGLTVSASQADVGLNVDGGSTLTVTNAATFQVASVVQFYRPNGTDANNQPFAPITSFATSGIFNANAFVFVLPATQSINTSAILNKTSGSLTLGVPGAIKVGGLRALGGNVTVTSQGGAALDLGTIIAGGSVLLNVSPSAPTTPLTGSTITTADITAGASVIAAAQSITTGNVVAGDTIGITSTVGGVTYGTLSAGLVNPVQQSQQGYAVGIRSVGAILGGAINARGNVGAVSQTSTITTGDIGSQQSIVLLSSRAVTTGNLNAASTTGGVYIANSSMFTTNNGSLDPAVYFAQTPVPVAGVQGTPGTITVGNVSAARFRAASTGVFRAGNIAASTLLNLSSNSNFILGDITAPTITLAAPAIQTGALSSTGAISLNAPIAIVAGNVNAASLTAQSGGVARFGDISTSGDIFVGSFAPPQQLVGAQTPGTVLVGNVTSSGGGVNLFSQRGTVTTGNINVAGFAQLSAQVGSITTGNIQASEVGLFALGAITTGSVTATNGEIDIEAGPDDENDDFIATPGADVTTGALVATDEISVTGGGNVRVASATVNAPRTRNPEEFYEVKIGAGGNITVGDISAPGTIALGSLTGAIAAGNITTQDAVAVLAGGSASFGSVTTAGTGYVYVGNASQIGLVDTDDGIDTSLLLANAPVRAGGAVSFAGPVTTGRFDVASTTGFSSAAVTASSVRVNTGGAASFGGAVTTPGAFTVSSGAFTAAGINAASVQVAASGAASFNGAVVAPTINVASNDIAIGANGSLGGASTTALTLTNSGTGPSTLGGTAQTTGYTLDASEIGRLRATQIAFNSTGNVSFNTASINASTALNGATGGFRVTTPASIRIAGNVDFTNMAATNTATFVAGQRFEVVTPTGQLRLLGANNAVNGIANITAANVAVGSATLLDQLAANPRFTGRDTALALGNSGTAVNSSGYIQAGTLAFTVGNTLLIANSGTATAPAGFTAGTGGVTVAAQGQGTTPIDVVIYGRSLDAAGTPSTSSGTVSTVVIAPGSTARISTTSTVNGCGFGGATCTAGAVVTNTVQNQLTQIAATLQSAVTGIGGGATNGPAGGAADNGGTSNNNAASDQGSDGEDDGGDDGTSAATSSAVRVNVLIDTSSIGGGGPSFDTPVTSSGNASLWGGDAGGDVGSTGAGGLGDTSGPLGDLGGGGALGGGSFGGTAGGAVNAGGGAGASFGAGATGGSGGGAGLTGGASGGASSAGGAATGGTSSTGAAGSTSGAASTGGTGSTGGASTGGAAGGTAGSTSSSAGGGTSSTEGGASAQGGGSNGGAAGGSSAEGSANGQGGGTAATAATEGTSNSGGGGGGEAGASGSDAGTTPGGAAGGAAGGASGGANGGNNKDEKTDKPQGGTTGGIN